MKRVFFITLFIFIFGLILSSCSDNVDKIDKDSFLKQTPLMAASADGDVQKVKELIKKGANVNFKDSLKQTALMLSVYKGHKEVSLILLKSGANPNAVDVRGQTPIILAASIGDIKMVVTLLDYGANPAAKDQWGRTALSEITRIYGEYEAKEALRRRY